MRGSTTDPLRALLATAVVIVAFVTPRPRRRRGRSRAPRELLRDVLDRWLSFDPVINCYDRLSNLRTPCWAHHVRSSPSRLGKCRRAARWRQSPLGGVSWWDESQLHSTLSVWKTDNDVRVRDRYIRLSTRDHARASVTRSGGPICRETVAADARPETPVPPLNLHGKEGVDGSSPSEVLKDLQIDIVCCLF